MHTHYSLSYKGGTAHTPTVPPSLTGSRHALKPQPQLSLAANACHTGSSTRIMKDGLLRLKKPSLTCIKAVSYITKSRLSQNASQITQTFKTDAN